MDTKVLYISKKKHSINELMRSKQKNDIICMIKNVYVFVQLLNQYLGSYRPQSPEM